MRPILVLAVTLAAHAQSPAFEVASIKPSPQAGTIGSGPKASGGGASNDSRDPGRIDRKYLSVRSMILEAYKLKPYQLSAPEWTATALFDVVAKVPEGATRDDIPAMWQALLAGRFKLTIHRETRQSAIYALVIAPGGLRLRESTEAETTRHRAGFTGTPSSIHLRDDADTGAEIARKLTIFADRPVIDESGLTGKYQVDVEFQYQDLSTEAPEGPPVPTLAAAVEAKLGLKLAPRKGPVEMVIVDHLEKSPTGN